MKTRGTCSILGPDHGRNQIGKACLRVVTCGVLLLLFIFFFGAKTSAATPTKMEKATWDMAQQRFQDAKSVLVWSMVENDFAEFIQKYPNSDYYADAVVYEARAMFEQRKFDAAIALLTVQASRAGASADKFNYWTAMAWVEKKNDEQAAEAFARLAHDNPGSDLRTEALVREAQAHARLGRWPLVVEDLGGQNGPFQQLAATNSNSDLIVRGLLLLAQAQLVQKNYPAAEKTVQEIPPGNPRAELAWERQELLSRVELESGHAETALQSCSNLLAAAGSDPELKQRSIMLQGEILEGLGRLPEAIQAYQLNQDAGVPFERRRDALLRMVELTLRQNKIREAGVMLDDFWKKNPTAKDMDFELLIHGELRLKAALGGIGVAANDTNLLHEAQGDFIRVITEFTNSLYLGKAELNLGWCYLATGRTAESEVAFSNAMERLPVSAEQAVARFNLAQMLFQQKNYAGATSNFSALLEDSRYQQMPVVTNELFEPALYHLVQSGLEQGNSKLAWDAMSKILKWFPESGAAPRSMLLVGQDRNPQAAREILEACLQQYPQSGLVPEIKLAIARTYAEENDWTNALAHYDEWIGTYPNHPSLPRAEFARAWMTYRSGDLTNAFGWFTNFVAQSQTNAAMGVDDLPSKAQFWLGDYYWNLGEYQKAELNYEEILPTSPLAFSARMYAGRSAMARQSPQEATAYFTNLTANPNCPEGLKQQAYFALGDAYFTPATYENAITIFRYIITSYPGSAMAARAWGRLGDCYYAIALAETGTSTNSADAASRAMFSYTNAADAFQQAMQTTNAANRSETEFRLAQSYAAMAQLPSVDGRKTADLKLAFEHFLNVFHGAGQEMEVPDLFWVKEAGLSAAKLAEDLGEWDQAIQLYERLQLSLPQLRDNLEKKIASARDNIRDQKK